MNQVIAYLFSGNLINAISFTLAHSLWQGAVLSAITGLIMAGTRKSSSALRYNLLIIAMALFAVTVVATFYLLYNRGEARMPATAEYVYHTAPTQPETTVYVTAPSASVISTVSAYLNRYAMVIVCVWLLIVLVRCALLATGLVEIYRLRHKHTSNIGQYWEGRVQQLCRQLGIKRQVGIAQSERANTPMVVGHLKPLILIPLGMLNSLSLEEAEAVLLHELAHIRRSDYLVNLLQNMMEIILFFNPAVLWLSALIKAERENCCDDIAVTRSGKLNYLKALVACEEYHTRPLPYAMALKTSNSGLKKRVARIIHNKNQSLNRGEKALLAVCLITVGIFATAFANGGKPDKHAAAAQKAVATQSNTDSIPGGNEDTVYAQQTTDTTKKHTDASTVAKNNDSATIGQQTTETKPKSDSEWTQGMISDLLNDGIITSPNNLSFKIGTDEFVVNYQKQPDAVYQKYRAKYVVTRYSGPKDWIWYNEFDTQKWERIVAHKYIDPNTVDKATGIFNGKEN